ncbi:hypothetical protein NMG60_11024847 [Bertholletia excelsa]
MYSAVPKTTPLPVRLSPTSPNLQRNQIQPSPIKPKQRKTSFTALNSGQSALPGFDSTLTRPKFTADKLQSLAEEFRALPEPVDRVKRLLHHAALLPPFDDSARVEANRVWGCTVRVWVEVRMDAEGLMRFRADSDSEITKGFCSCLIWALDGATPAEVMMVRAEDLAEMNVGLSGRVQSRVNTWHNIFMSMQKRTRGLVEERYGEPISEHKHFPSLVVANGAFSES